MREETNLSSIHTMLDKPPWQVTYSEGGAGSIPGQHADSQLLSSEFVAVATQKYLGLQASCF